MNAEDIRPSRWYYGLAGFVFLAGGALFALLLFKNLSGLADKLKQVVVPGKSEITLTEPGGYTIFYEYQSVVGNRVYSTERNLSGLECALVSKDTRAKVALSRASTNSTYAVGGRSGESIFDFRIERPGTYELSAWYPEGREGPEVVLAVGHDFTTKLLLTIFGGLGILFGSIALAVAIALVTFIKREKAEKRLKGSLAS